MKRRRDGKRRRSITSVDEKRVLTVIATWPSDRPLRWESLLDALERDLGHRWTRQGLAKRDAIKTAFQAKSQAFRVDVARKRPASVLSPEDVVRDQNTERLEKELREAKAKIERYQELFVVYQYNAMIRGVSVEQLEAAIPPIGRGQTDTGICPPLLRALKGKNP